ncbi:MAG: MarR family transcriptional regulator [Candidatus Zophobacter franzmannii]|nr:MarR family transcriptional regulator [Candidatus Zophobacter franzmannii]
MKYSIEDFLTLTNRMQKILYERDNLHKSTMNIGKMECNMLKHLFTQGKPVSMNQLAAALNVSHSRVTRIMDNLVLKGYALRKHSEEDRRRWYALVTDDGKSLATECSKKIFAQQRKVFDDIKEDERDDMYECLDAFVKTYERMVAKTKSDRKK